ncbi:MAG: hypothetical protein HGA44_17880 [Cellulomonadaceae bacterium]|nr:hypothetical protein [Cellulomonadaceae bacterium]
MKITVLSVAPGDDPLVECDTPAGRLDLRWRGASVPAPGDSLDVELDIPGRLTWGEDVECVEGTGSQSGPGWLAGSIDAIDGEVVTLRVGDSLVLLEVIDRPPSPDVGKRVAVRPGELEAWPTGI